MRVSYNARWHDIVLSIAFRVWKVGLLQNHTCARENDRVIFRSVWFPPSRTTHFRNLMYWTPQIAPLLSPCSLTRCDFVAITYFRTVWSTHRWLDTRWIIWSYFYQYYYVIVVPVVFLEKIRNDKGRERGGDRSLVIFRIAIQKTNAVFSPSQDHDVFSSCVHVLWRGGWRAKQALREFYNRLAVVPE